ncbi:hypothetical protein DPMN_094453 [Dreissena polymorpha]|uniref:Uncharacterized protein n=1 Tax=Dreissena polymorpha TaxID=45954 RepID=A0A9D4L5S3_DREPO|nr:hypothetical protein DPMN_094453 [Dreissena polymorpha]
MVQPFKQKCLRGLPCISYTEQNEYVCNTCSSTRAPTGDCQTGLRWTRHQAGLSEEDCSQGQASWRSTSRPSEVKLDGRCKRVDIPSYG